MCGVLGVWNLIIASDIHLYVNYYHDLLEKE